MTKDSFSLQDHQGQLLKKDLLCPRPLFHIPDRTPHLLQKPNLHFNYPWPTLSGSREGNRKSSRKLLPNEASRRSKKNRHFKSGGILKVDGHKRKKLPGPRMMLLAQREAGKVTAIGERVAEELEVAEEEGIHIGVVAVEEEPVFKRKPLVEEIRVTMSVHTVYKWAFRRLEMELHRHNDKKQQLAVA
jgi:hypothetical protein